MVSVVANVSFDPQTGYYTYSYMVSNDPSSPNTVAAFGVAPASDPLAVTAPPHWDAFYGFDERDDAIVWAVVDTLTPPPPGATANLYPSPFEIQAGETKSGFSFTTPVPPAEFGAVSFYAEGFDTIPGSVAEPYPTLFASGVSGPTDGPGSAVSVERGAPGSTQVKIEPPIPNPVTGSAWISFRLPRSATIRLTIADVSGRRIRVLAEGERPAGAHSVSWDGNNAEGKRVPPGVYFYRLMVDGESIGGQRIVVLP